MRAALLCAALLLMFAVPAAAAPRLVPIGNFDQPVYVASPPHDQRIFVVEKPGRIKLADGRSFLDVTGMTDDSGERGLLSMAFSPGYATNGLFYVFLTATGGGNLTVLEFQRSAADPNRANPTPRRQFQSLVHDSASPYHNGGQLQIGPDSMLYVSTGEGHESANAQNTSSPLGKILRLDPATGGPAAGNPHGLVWAYGLRNPWRFSFDRLTGDLAIGDVGAGTWEEIDWAPAPGRGRDMNFGWDACEGPDPMHVCGEDPIIAHSHGSDGFCAIVGGYVVRDPGLPTLNGRYLYGDNCRSQLWSAIPRTGADDKITDLTVSGLTSFGEDSCGHIYAASLNGPVYRIQDGAVSPCPGGVATMSPDRTAPGLSVTLSGSRKTLRTRKLRVAARCNERCAATIGARLIKVRRLATRHRDLLANQRTVVTLKLSKSTMKKLRKRLKHHSFVRIGVTVRATDAAGNTKKVTRHGRIKRRSADPG
jgi:Glucose / Sorbosone dehydrogenase